MGIDKIIRRTLSHGARAEVRGRLSAAYFHMVPCRNTARGGSCRAVFLDRDGVINRPVVIDAKPYPPRSPGEFELLPGVAEACSRLRAAGFLLVVVTNQPDVGRGTLDRAKVEAIHAEMCRRLPLDLIKVCYHAGEKYGEPCGCRKPKPGMLLEAARELGIDLAMSFIVGDRWRDIDCGKRAGCQTIFIDWNYDEPLQETPDFRAGSLLDAARLLTTPTSAT